MTKENQEKNRSRHIENAVNNWNNKLNNIYMWWEEKKYSKEFCLKQIEFFKNIK
jgi:hypothetical protein